VSTAQDDRFFGEDPPWAFIYAVAKEDAYELSWRVQAAGGVARVIRGSKMRTVDGFFDELAAALQFPAYFGENWPALQECLTDLMWLRGPAYLLVVADSDRLFQDEPIDPLPTLLKIIEVSANEWATPSPHEKPWAHGRVPFHVVFQVAADAVPSWNVRLNELGLSMPVVDLDHLA
jgi:hypothetical protein